MKKLCFSLVTVLVFLSGCVDNIPAPSGKIQVVTSFYPLYEIAQQVGGDYVDVKNLVPAGAEPHDYELTPKDTASVYESDILFVNGLGLEPWFKDNMVRDLLLKTKPQVVNSPYKYDDIIVGDPHVWLDPDYYGRQMTAFEDTLVKVDPGHEDYYSSRAENFRQQLADLDGKYKSGFEHCVHKQFVTNHAAFGYLAKRYHLEMIAVAGISPDAEPSLKSIVGLITVIKEKNIHYILTESLVSAKIADVIAQEVGAKTLVLNPLEGLTDEQIAQGQNYISVMQQNLKNLQIALECKQQ